MLPILFVLSLELIPDDLIGPVNGCLVALFHFSEEDLLTFRLAFRDDVANSELAVLIVSPCFLQSVRGGGQLVQLEVPRARIYLKSFLRPPASFRP